MARTQHMIGRETKGVFVIAATPFENNGGLDLPSLDRLIDFYLERGANGLTILGMMGEANKLSNEETRAVLTCVMKRVNGTVPVVVGVSAPGLDNLRSLAHFAMEEGAAGIMVAPTAGPAREERVIGYFTELCEALDSKVPVCFQDYPQTTGVPVSAATILNLTRSLPQIVMLKHEDCPGLSKIEAVRGGSGNADTPRMSILCGNGGLYLPQELSRGADGAMTGFAYPEMLVDVVKRHAASDFDGAEDLFDAYLPILRYEQQPVAGLAIRKEILRRRGTIACSRTRAPGPKLSSSDYADVERLMARTQRNLERLSHGS